MKNENNKEVSISDKDKQKLIKLRESINSNPELREQILRNSTIKSYLDSVNETVSKFESLIKPIFADKFADAYRTNFENLNIGNMIDSNKYMQEVGKIIADINFPTKNLDSLKINTPTLISAELSKDLTKIVVNSVPKNFGDTVSSYMTQMIKDTKEVIGDTEDLRIDLLNSLSKNNNVIKDPIFGTGEYINHALVNQNLAEMLIHPDENADFYITVEPKDESTSDSQTNSYTITDKNGNVLSREESVNFLEFVLANLLQE